MLFEVTNELVDAIIRNEGRYLDRQGGRERRVRFEPRPVNPAVPRPNSRAAQKPDWVQLPPEMNLPQPVRQG